MTSPATTASGTAALPDYAPIPRSALGPARNDVGSGKRPSRHGNDSPPLGRAGGAMKIE